MTLLAVSAAPAADARGSGSVAQTPGARLIAHRRRPWLSRRVVAPVILLGVVALGFLWWNARRGAAISSIFAGWPTVVLPTSIVGGFLFSVAVGMFFGYYPARKASHLDPIEALHFE
jgi:hypothetical protein